MVIDNKIDQLNGIGKPEERDRIIATCDPVKTINSLFELWSMFLIKNAPPYWIVQFTNHKTLIDLLSDEACRIIKPHEAVIPGVIKGEEYFEGISNLKSDYRKYAGLFYTAIVNACIDQKQIIIPSSTPMISFLGYKMQKGIIELFGDAYDFGSYAEGGYFANYGNVLNFIGANAKKGFFVNYGVVKDFGIAASGGTFINYGQIQRDSGLWGNWDLFISFRSQGNLFGNRLIIRGSSGSQINPTLHVTFKEVYNDKNLHGLISELRRVTKKRIIEETKLHSIVNQIKEYLGNYETVIIL